MKSKSIIPMSIIAILDALALVGCNQGPSNSTDTPSPNSSMSNTNGVMGGTTNMSATKGMPNMNMPASTNTTGAAKDAAR